MVDAVVVRRLVAFDDDRRVRSSRGRVFDRGDQLEVVLEPVERRHEDVQHAVARLDAQRRADHARGITIRRRCENALAGPRSLVRNATKAVSAGSVLSVWVCVGKWLVGEMAVLRLA